jgi:hypothetical protein
MDQQHPSFNQDEIITLGTIVLSKTLDKDGNITIGIDADEEIHIWEQVGMLTLALDYTRLLGAYEIDTDEEAEDE